MTRSRTAGILALVLSAALVASAADAGAITAVERARKDRREAAHTIADLRRLLHSHASSRRTAITLLEVLEVRGGSHLDPARWRAAQRIAARRDRKADRAVARVRRRVDRRIDQLLAQRDRLAAWLEVTAVFQVCPVDRYIALYDDFGEMVRLPKVPVHRHMGNDITAPIGTPIRAPFAGTVSAGYGVLGGREIRLTGPRGYVYGAHLSALGRLGWVKAGTVIGYVGATGDATAPHLHLEWHPGAGGAVDPHGLLALACLPV
ncbi:MAG TPA: M23 family metallopeptidase [Actinomycetota bacterium]|nr:M23 family metallopeptidase [Actinomycetota bacterium]